MYIYIISICICICTLSITHSRLMRIKNWVFKALPCDGNILNLHICMYIIYLYIISVCNIYLWPGICETVLGAGNTQLSATFLRALNLWLTIIWTGSKAQCQRIMLMKTINLGHRINRTEHTHNTHATQHKLQTQFSRYNYK